MENCLYYVENDYQCPVCLEGFAFLSRLNEHAVEHVSFLPNVAGTPPLFPNSKPFHRIKRVNLAILPKIPDHKITEPKTLLKAPEVKLTEFKPNLLVWAKVSCTGSFWPAIVLNSEQWNVKNRPEHVWVYWLGAISSERFSSVRLRYLRDFVPNFLKIFNPNDSRKRYLNGVEQALKFYKENVEISKQNNEEIGSSQCYVTQNQWLEILKPTKTRSKREFVDKNDENLQMNVENWSTPIKKQTKKENLSA